MSPWVARGRATFGDRSGIAKKRTHILRVHFWQRKTIFRDIEIVSSDSLYDLAFAIVTAFNFDFDHAFGFYSGLTPSTMMERLPKYELFVDMGADEGGDAKSVKKTKIAEAFHRVGQAMAFLFDYGDEWLFRVEMIGEGEKVAKVKYPRVTAKKGTAPPQYPDANDD